MNFHKDNKTLWAEDGGLMYAKIKVTLDLAPPGKRHAFVCKGCGKTYPADDTRYCFERYKFCSNCVEISTMLKNIVYGTTLKVEKYEGIKEAINAYKGQPTFPIPLIKEKEGLKVPKTFFTEATFFNVGPNLNLIPGGLLQFFSIPVRILDELFIEKYKNILNSYAYLVESKNVPLLVYRCDLKPFNIEIG